MALDPICGMTVDETTALSAERDGQTFYFCSEHCRQKFLELSSNAPTAKATDNGESCSGTADAHPMPDRGEHVHHERHGHEHGTAKPSATAKYFCPMCQGVESNKPGDCPKC